MESPHSMRGLNLVQRLRKIAGHELDHPAAEAADEIERLNAALQGLLATSDLNFDSLEPDTVRAIQAARAVMAKVSA